jgi:hypothetical protein
MFTHQRRNDGFALIELLIAAFLLLVLGLLLCSILTRIQVSAADWAEIQGALDNTRLAVDRVAHLLREAGNDPYNQGFAALHIVSPLELRLRSDLTGSVGPAKSNRGDPDGDTQDPWEDIVIRYSLSADMVTIVHGRGPAQTVAQEISDFSIRFYDQGGLETTDGNRARLARISATGRSIHRLHRNGKRFSITLTSFVHLTGVT